MAIPNFKMRRFSDSSQLPNLECFISQTYVLMEQHVVCNEDINYVLRMFCCSEYAEHVMDSTLHRRIRNSHPKKRK